MTRLRLTFACGIYDRMAALRTGDVTVEGIDLNYIAIDSPREIFDRMGARQEFDVAEFSSSEFISRCSRAAIVRSWHCRCFRRGCSGTATSTSIAAPASKVPKDLEHRRVGVPLYTQTAAVWIRGHLAHQYGVDLSTIRWVEGAIEKAGPHGNPHAPPLLKPVAIERNDQRPIACANSSQPARSMRSRRRAIRGHIRTSCRCLPTPRRSSAPSTQETRIFPIMHLVAIRRDRYERDPWIASSLYKAFVAAKNRALAQLHRSGAHAYMLPWIDQDLKEIDEVFGGDPWPYGIDANRPTLEALVQYMAEQHLIARPLAVDDLFVPLPGLTGR